MNATVARPKAARNWQCQECGKRLTDRQCETAMSVGCPKCGSVDMELSERGVDAFVAEGLAR